MCHPAYTVHCPARTPGQLSICSSGKSAIGVTNLRSYPALNLLIRVSFSASRMSSGSPRPNSARQNRKRALSISPYSDTLELNSVIRFSPNTLVSLVNCSRSSSSSSGSYGHLSPGSISPNLSLHRSMTPHLQHLQAHLMRSGALLPPLSAHQSPPSSLYHATLAAADVCLPKTEVTVAKIARYPRDLRSWIDFNAPFWLS